MAGPQEPSAGGSAYASQPRRRLEELRSRTPSTARYTVRSEVARGGMGAILDVWDEDLRRALAMKVLLEAPGPATASQAEDRPLARFLEEAQVTGQLDHPGVVPVHELGVDEEGKAFFTMRLVRGRDLDTILQLAHEGQEGWSRTRAVDVLVRICETMAYAHQKGVLHRDLKPANVMVGGFGEVYVMDWGLARVKGEHDRHDLRIRSVAAPVSIVRTDRDELRTESVDSPLVTMDGDIIGTPAYMPPEQANGEIDGLDERCDVYAIGAMLYHLLAGHAPHTPPGEGLGAIEVWNRVREGPPAALASVAPEAPSELIAICEKAMAREREQRYGSVRELGEDLRSYLEGRVVRAYETGAWAELRKWIGRNRGTAFASAAAVLLSLVGAAGVAAVQVRARGELEEKNEELARATAAAQASATDALSQRERADASAEVARAAQLAAERRAEELRVERDVGQQVNRFLTDLFESPDPARARGELVTAKELLDRGARSIPYELAGEPVRRGRLMHVMGAAYLSLGLYADAQRMLDEAARVLTRELGADDEATLQCELDRGRLGTFRGSYAEAIALLGDVERRAKGAGAELVRLRARNELARAYLFDARYAEAEEIWHELLELGPVEGLRDPTPLLADLYRNQGRYDEARELLEEALARRVADLGEDHPDTLDTRDSLAGVYLLLERREEALDNRRLVVEGRTKVLGPTHVDTLASKAELAYFLYVDGRYQEAEDLFLEVLPEQERALGEGHVATLVTLNNLGTVFEAQGRLDEAEQAYSHGLDLATESLGPDHPDRIRFVNNLAFLQFKEGRLEEADGLYREVIEGCRRVFGEDGLQTLGALENHVRVLIGLESWSEAEDAVRELLLHTEKDDKGYAERTRLFDQVQAGLRGGG